MSCGQVSRRCVMNAVKRRIERWESPRMASSRRPPRRYRCRFCGLILHAWYPVLRRPNGAMLRPHLLESHRAASRPYVARMRTHDDIGRIAAEAYEVVEGDRQEGTP